MNKFSKSVIWVSFAALGVVGCGGGGGAGSTAPVGTNSTVGVLSGFGSVFVNGVEFDTSGASISVDGSSASENELQVGMIVSVIGNSSGATGTASSISTSDELEGLVESNSIVTGTDTGTMMIMGQLVTITDTTVFESKVAGITTFSEVVAGNIVELHGYSDGNGSIVATRLEVKAADMSSYNGTIELKGIVSNLGTDATTNTSVFDIGGMTVDYSTVPADLSDLPNGVIADGLFVEVKSSQGVDATSGYLVADKVELEDDESASDSGDDGEEMEVKGAITTSINGARMFSIGMQVVLVTDNTKFEDVSESGLTSGVMVEVEGTVNSNGELVASDIEAKEGSSSGGSSPTLKIKSTIATITPVGTSPNSGSITLSDSSSTVIQITNSTIMEDDYDGNGSVTPVHNFNLSNLANGDYVEIKYYVDSATGNNIALKLERDDNS